MSESTATSATERPTRKVRQGVVVSDTNDKTIVVAVERRTTHGLYGKTVNRTAKFHAHDEANDAGVGDTVRIVETRPLRQISTAWALSCSE